MVVHLPLQPHERMPGARELPRIGRYWRTFEVGSEARIRVGQADADRCGKVAMSDDVFEDVLLAAQAGDENAFAQFGAR